MCSPYAGLNVIAVILQTTFWNAIFNKNYLQIDSKFTDFFPHDDIDQSSALVQLMVCCLTNVDQGISYPRASLSHSESKVIRWTLTFVELYLKYFLLQTEIATISNFRDIFLLLFHRCNYCAINCFRYQVLGINHVDPEPLPFWSSRGLTSLTVPLATQ